MELFFLTRGKSNEVEEWAKWMATRCLPFPITEGTGKIIPGTMECQLRPIQLWDFVFPREQLDIVLNSLGLPNNYATGVNLSSKLWALRKMIGLKEIPEPKEKTIKMFMPYDRIKDINIIGVGLKEDGDIAVATHEKI